MLTVAPTVESYADAFALERARVYPALDAFERQMGTMVDRDHLEAAARVLACPVKANPPNWQHGRLIYARTKRYLTDRTLAGQRDPVVLLDIGTAKGFSALCLQWALRDAGVRGHVVSVDVIDPRARVLRNTVAEVDGLKTLDEILAPWPDARAIQFVSYKHGSREWFFHNRDRVHVAYVDGKHSYEAVAFESEALAKVQQAGDVMIFDDIQIPGVHQAVTDLKGYGVEWVHLLATRGYAMARKR